MDSTGIVNALRDAANRRRRDLTLPSELDLEELLDLAADEIEHLVQHEAEEVLHCDGCCCGEDDEDETPAPAPAHAP